MERKNNQKINLNKFIEITQQTKQEFYGGNFIEDSYITVLCSKLFKEFIEQKGFIYQEINNVFEEGSLEIFIKKNKQDRLPYKWFLFYTSKFVGYASKIDKNHYVLNVEKSNYSFIKIFEIFKEAFKRYKKELDLIQNECLTFI